MIIIIVVFVIYKAYYYYYLKKHWRFRSSWIYCLIKLISKSLCKLCAERNIEMGSRQQMVSFKNAREEAFLNIATIQRNHTRLCLCGLEFSNVVSGSRDFKKIIMKVTKDYFLYLMSKLRQHCFCDNVLSETGGEIQF